MPPSLEQHWVAARLREIRAAEQCQQWQDYLDRMCVASNSNWDDMYHVWSLPLPRANPLPWVDLPPPEVTSLRAEKYGRYTANGESWKDQVRHYLFALVVRISTLRTLTRSRQAVETFIKNEFKKKVARREKLAEEDLALLRRFVGEAEYRQHPGHVRGHFMLDWDIGRSLRDRLQGSVLSAETFEAEADAAQQVAAQSERTLVGFCREGEEEEGEELEGEGEE